MMMSKEYWVTRFEREEERNAKLSLQHLKIAKRQYRKLQDEVEDKIRLWYSRYAKENEMTYQDAQKALSKEERQKLKISLKEYIRLGELQNENFDSEIEKLLKRVSAGVHISRLESMESEIRSEINKLYMGVERGLGEHFAEVVQEGFARTAHIIQSMTNKYDGIDAIPTELVNKMIQKPWTSDGVNWSKRIWKQQDKLTDELHNSLTRSLVLGQDVNTMVEDIAKRLDVGYSRVANLLMTESAAYHAKATEMSYKELEVEKYEILATLDTRTSSVCQGMDGKVFDRKEYKIGVTAPPFHCRCRTTTIPYFEDMTEGETRAARDLDGEYEEVKAMSYEKWKQAYLNERYGEEHVAYEIKVKKNRARDYEWFEELKSVVDKKFLPETLEKFQEMKYNDIVSYENLKLRYRILTNPAYDKINQGAQNKHILGTAEYKQELANGRLKSYFLEGINFEELYTKYRGTGEIIFDRSRKNELINLGYDIGFVYNDKESIWELARAIKIHYGKKGVHIVPKYME